MAQAVADVYADLERQAILQAVSRTPSPGKYAEIWRTYHAQVARFVEKEKPAKVVVVEEHAMAAAAAATTTASVRSELAGWWMRYGGMKAPHVHLADNIYQLTPEQWGSFTAEIGKTLAAKLQQPGRVSFDAFVETAGAVANM